MEKKTFEQLGGRKILEKMTKIFYDKVYDHPWIGKYFRDTPQEFIEIQQINFLQGALGGDKIYAGKLPIPAHKHMMINEELFELRNKLLLEALHEAGACEELIERIMKIDNAFKTGIVKKSVDECEKRFRSDEILDFPNPDDRFKKAS